MPVTVNLRHLESDDLRLEGELPVEELDLQLRDAVIRVERPLEYRLDVEKLGVELLAKGSLRLALRCECVRCLSAFETVLELPDWTCLLPLEGEDSVPISNDSVDLTPYIREDILLEFPQHPVCGKDCRGLPNPQGGKELDVNEPGHSAPGSSAWSELDKLKF
ncbi:MAG: YceD family protein [Verrucomicrobiota bacterium]